MPDPTDTPDPLQSLTEIAERCQAYVKAANPSKLPILASDVADMAEILQGVIRRLDARDSYEREQR